MSRTIFSLQQMAAGVVRSRWDDELSGNRAAMSLLFDLEWERYKPDEFEKMTEERIDAVKCQLWTLIGGASESSMQEGAAAAAAALPTSRKNDTVKRQVLPGAQDNTLRFEVHQLCGKLGLHTESSESADGRVVFAWKPEGWKWGFGPKNAPSSKKRKRKKNENKSNKRWVKQCDDDERRPHDCYDCYDRYGDKNEYYGCYDRHGDEEEYYY